MVCSPEHLGFTLEMYIFLVLDSEMLYKISQDHSYSIGHGSFIGIRERDIEEPCPIQLLYSPVGRSRHCQIYGTVQYKRTKK